MKTFFKQTIVSILSWQARLVLRKFKPKIIAVTGSVGKTSTKDAIFSVMAKKFYVRKSNKSFNSEIGIPLTILGLSNAWSDPFEWLKNIIKGFRLICFGGSYPAWLVLEVGADRPGDIERTCKWLKPDIAVITHIGKMPVHVEFFESIEALINEKRFLARALKPEGLLLVDSDDSSSLNTRDFIVEGQSLVICGHNPPADILAVEERISYSEDRKVLGMKFNILCKDQSMPVNLQGTLGATNVYPALFAFAIGKYLDVDDSQIIDAVASYEPPAGRKRIIEGIKGSTIIDDTYNSSPVALHAALDIIDRIEIGGQKIAILGDMMELGEYSIEEHYKVGKHVGEVCDKFIAVGMRARKMVEGALDAGMADADIFQYESSREAGKFAESLLDESRLDVVLVKGAQSMRMERAVEEIMAHPEDKAKLLVRQEVEWMVR